MGNNIGFSIWLIPSDEQCRKLQKLISELSEKYKAPSFIPHVTIFCGEVESLQEVQMILNDSIKESKPITLPVKDVGATANLFKTLFVTFEDNSQLNALYSTVSGEISCDSDYHLHAHLSLLYKDMSLEEKQRLAEEVNIKLHTITFDKRQLIYEEDPEVVSSWKCVYEYDLAKQEVIKKFAPAKKACML